MGVDPGTVAVQRNLAHLREQTYETAANDLLPGDFSQRQLGIAAQRFAGTVARADASLIERESAGAALVEATEARVAAVDAVLAAPQETFSNLVLTAARNPGAIPIHPLLTNDDAAAAGVVRDRLRAAPVRARLEQAAAAIEQRRPDAPALALALVRTLSGETDAIARGALPTALKSEEVVPAQALVQALNQRLPLFDELERLRPDAIRLAGEAAVDAAAAQVLFAEALGRDALLAGRAVRFGTLNSVAGFERSGGTLRRLVALSEDNAIVEVDATAPEAGADRIELHRRRVELARTAYGEATIASILARGAPEVAQADAALEAAAIGVNARLQRSSDPAVQAAGAAAPVLVRTAALLRSRIAAADAGLVSTAPPARAAAATDLGVIEGEFAAGLARIRQLVPRIPGLAESVTGLEAAGRQFQTAIDRVAPEREGSPAADQRILAARDLRSSAIRVAAIDLGLAPGVPSFAAQLALEGTDFALEGDEGISLPPAPDEAAPLADRIAFSQALGARSPALLASSLRAGLTSAPSPSRLPPNLAPAPAPPDPNAALVQSIRERVGGLGWAHSFSNERELQQFAQSRVGQFGAVHLRSDLENPEYVQRLFRERVGGFGYVHTFKSEEEMQAFVQSRLGQFGIAHRRSDLQDAAYLQRLFQSRVGGMGWSNTFKSLDEFKAFLESRLGGLGAITTCLDLQRRGVPPAVATAILRDAASRSRTSWETEAQYQDRMLRERPDLFTRDPSGAFRQRTHAEQQAERRQSMLATGEWIEDPRTGNLVRRDSKAGAQVISRMLDARPRTVRVRLDDGRWLELSVPGFSSLQSALDEALARQDLRRNANGDWVDRDGRVVLNGERARGYDANYREAMDRRAPGFSGLLTYRRPQERPGTPPISPSQQFRDLEATLRNGFGYTLADFTLGDRSLDLEVRGGETVAEALQRTLAGDSRFRFNADGDLVDRRTGRPVRTARELAELDTRNRDRVARTLFGNAEGGIGRETLLLAENGTPAQRAQAQAILAQLGAQVAQLQAVTASQAELSDALRALAADRTLTPSQRRAQEDALRAQLATLADRRTQLESAIAAGTRAANRSAADVVQRQLTYGERQALESADRVRALAETIDSLRRELLRDPGPTERRNLERRLAEAERELFHTSREFRDAARELPANSAVGALAPRVDLAAYGITSATVADLREARAVAAAVRFEISEGVSVAYYVGSDGRPLLDPNGRKLFVTAQEAEGFERRRLNELARNLDNYQEDRAAYDRRLATIARLQAELAAAGTTTERLAIERRLAAARSEADELAGRIDTFVSQFNAYAAGDETRRRGVFDAAATLAIERAAAREALQRGASTIQVLDANGNWIAYESPEMRRLREEREARLAAAGVTDSDALAAARRAASPPPPAARPDPAALEAARLRREQQTRLTAEYERRASALGEAERSLTTAETRLREARAAAFGRGDPALDRAVAEAEAAVARARQERDQRAVAATDAAAIAGANDPGLADRLAALARGVEEGTAAVAALDRTVADLRRQLERDANLPAVTRQTLEQQLRALEAARAAAAQETLSRAATLAAARENAAFTEASPEYNAQRLAELRRRVEASGRPASEALSALEAVELERRAALGDYFGRVDGAMQRVRRLANLTARQRADPRSLTSVERFELDQGLTDVEMRLLAGDLQRRGLLAAAEQTRDPGQAEALRSLVGQWMADPAGARAGTLLTGESPVAALSGALGFLDRTDLFDSARAEAFARLENRRAALAEAQEAFRRDPTSANATTVSLARESVSSAERLLDDADRELRRARETAPAARLAVGLPLGDGSADRIAALARDIEQRTAAIEALDRTAADLRRQLAGGAGLPAATRQALEQQLRAVEATREAAVQERIDRSATLATARASAPYLERLQADQQAARAQAEAEARARLAPYEDARRRHEEGLPRIAAINAASDKERAEIESDILRRTNEVGRLRGQYYDFEARLAAGGLSAESRAFIEQRLRELDTQIGARERGVAARQADLRQSDLARERQLAEILRTLPAPWELDPAIRAAEEDRRYVSLFQATAELEQLREGHAAKLAQFASRIGDFERQIATARAAGDTARTASLERALADTRRQRSEVEAILRSSEQSADTARRELIARNRADGLGPADDADLLRLLASLGVDPSAAFRADPEMLARQIAGANRLVDTAVATNISRADPSLARLFASELVANAEWSDIPKGAAYGLVGAGRGAVALIASIPDLVELGGSAAWAVGRTTVETAAAYGDLLAEAIAGHDLGLLDTVGTTSLDAINRGVNAVRTTSLSEASYRARAIAGILVDDALRKASTGDVEANAAQLAGRIAFEVGLGFVDPAAALNTLAQAGRAGSALGGARGVAAWAAAGEEAAVKLETLANVLSKAGGTVADARAALNQSALGTAVNRSFAGRSFGSLINLTGEEASIADGIGRQLRDADRWAAEAAAANPSEAARLLAQARSARERAFADLAAANTSPAVVQHLHSSHDLERAALFLADSARAEAALIATGVRTTPEALAAARSAIEAVRTGRAAAATPGAPAAAIDAIAASLAPPGSSPALVRQVAAAEAEAAARARAAIVARVETLDQQLATGARFPGSPLDSERASLARQASALERQEALLRAAANPDDAAARAAAVAALAEPVPPPNLLPASRAPPAPAQPLPASVPPIRPASPPPGGQPFVYSPARIDDATPVSPRPPTAPGRDIAHSNLPITDPFGRSRDPGNFNFVDPQTGELHQLGEFLGEGSFSRVYTLATPGNSGAVIKFRTATEIEGTGVSHADMVAASAVASQRLEAAGIPQLRVLASRTDAAVPYLVVERLPADAVTFSYEATRTADGLARAGFSADHERAVVDLYRQLADKGLVAQDLKIDNLYFYRRDGRTVAGVLDHDRILPWEEARNSYWMRQMLEDPVQGGHLLDWHAGRDPSYTDAHHFMAKMLAAKGWVKMRPDGGGVEAGRLSLESLRDTPFAAHLPPAQPGATGGIADNFLSSATGGGRAPIPPPTVPPRPGTVAIRPEELASGPTVRLPPPDLPPKPYVKAEDPAIAALARQPPVRSAADLTRVTTFSPNFRPQVSPGAADAIAPQELIRRTSAWNDVPVAERTALDRSVLDLVDEAAAVGNPWARRLQGALHRGEVRIFYDPRMVVDGYGLRRGNAGAAGPTEMLINPIRTVDPLTGLPDIRRPEELAISLIHEFAHVYEGPARAAGGIGPAAVRGGYNEARAFIAEETFARDMALARSLNGRDFTAPRPGRVREILGRITPADNPADPSAADRRSAGIALRQLLEAELRADPFYGTHYPQGMHPEAFSTHLGGNQAAILADRVARMERFLEAQPDLTMEQRAAMLEAMLRGRNGRP